MWATYLKQEQFIEVFRAVLSQDPPSLEPLEGPQELRLQKSDMAMVWGEEPGLWSFLPELIVLKSGSKREFLARANTYMPSLRPLTGICRVVELDEVRNLSEPAGREHRKRLLSAAIGMAIAEAMSRSRSDHGGRFVSYRECLETCSYSCGRGYLLGYREHDLENILGRWTKIQSTSRRLRNAEPVGFAALDSWSLLDSLSGGDLHRKRARSLMEDLVGDVADKGTGSQNSVSKLADKLGIRKDILDIASEGTREARVGALEEAIIQLATGASGLKDSGDLGPFAAGYIVSQMAPGELEYLPLVTQMSGGSPIVAIWYGLFAGVHPKSAVLESGSGLGWKVGAELSGPFDWGTRPRADLDSDEYMMLGESDRQIAPNKALRPGSTTIELAPGVDTVTAIRPTDEQRSFGQKELFEAEYSHRETQRILKDVDSAMRQLSHARTNMEQIFGMQGSGKKKGPSSGRRS